MNRAIKFRCWVEGIGMVYGVGFTGDGGVFDEDGNSYSGELMQYTGLHDKSNIRIYEGDVIVRYWPDGTEKNRRIVKWDRNRSGFNITRAALDAKLFFTSGIVQGFEIIGNIYENPELLEDES